VSSREHRPFDIGSGTTIGADAHLERAILWDRVTVGAGAQLVNCIVADDVTIAPGTRLEDVVLIRSNEGLASHPL